MRKEREKVGNDIYGVNSNWKRDQKLGETAETGFRHNDRYHQYFSGYTEIRIPKENGKYRIERVYTDDYHMQDISNAKWYGFKFLHLLFALLSAILYIFLMTREGLAGNHSKFVAIPGFVVVIFLLFFAASTIANVFTKRKMTNWEKKASSGRILRYSLVTAVLFFFTAGLIIVNALISGNIAAAEFLLAFGVAVAGLLALASFLLETKTPYRTEKNSASEHLPEGEAHLIL